MWRTNYLGHDKQYQKLRTEGKPGWSSEEDIREMLAFVEVTLLKEGLNPSGRLLELGCGDGGLSLPLARMGFETCGIDIAPTAIAWAQEKAQAQGLSIDFRIGNVLDLPYSDDFFDLVVDGHCLHCIIGEDRKKFLSQALRVTRPGGLFLVMTMCNEVSENFRTHFDPVTRCLVKEGVAGRYIGRSEDILREITEAGFRVKSSSVTVDPSHQGDLKVAATK
jgi:2-polyprenyl-3-methyl-5-hydroxy-6-metoxy-1,4-benzoquinol methylase